MRALAAYLLAGLAAVLPAAADDRAEVPREVQAALTDMASDERGVREAAAKSALAMQHPALFAPLTKLLDDEHRAVREAALRALAARERNEERAKAARAIEARLEKLDREPGSPEEAAVVVQALHDLAQPTSIEPLLDGVLPTTEVGVAAARLMAVGNVPTKQAVEELIDHAARGRRAESHRGAAIKALQYATGVKLANLDAWHRWWSENKRTYDPIAAAAARQAARDEAAAKEQEKAARRAKRAEKAGEGDGAPPEDAPPPR
jgi:HEAT repeat protein